MYEEPIGFRVWPCVRHTGASERLRANGVELSCKLEVFDCTVSLVYHSAAKDTARIKDGPNSIVSVCLQ